MTGDYSWILVYLLNTFAIALSAYSLGYNCAIRSMNKGALEDIKK